MPPQVPQPCPRLPFRRCRPTALRLRSQALLILLPCCPLPTGPLSFLLQLRSP